MKPKVAILVPEPLMSRILSSKEKDRLARSASVEWREMKEVTPELTKNMLRGAEACMTGWGTPQLTEELLDAVPNLRMIAHSAGSVKPIVSDAVWERGIQVTSCAAAIAVGVAEHTLGLMLSAMKRSYWFNEQVHQGGWRSEEELAKVVEPYGITVGVVGAGYVGRHFMKLLRSFELDTVLLYDPFVSDKEAPSLGATKVARLEDLLTRSDVISLHAPSLPETRCMINEKSLKLMKDGAILINTARGSLIDESALYEELKTGRITACLDVTDPEPPATDHPLRRLPNVVFTPHVAGTVANNLYRLGTLAVTELERFLTGEPPLYPVTKEDLARIA